MERGLEALLLGLSVGLVCLASCGAVLVPWLVVQQRPVLSTAWLLGQVLAGRLAGYLLFACVAWSAGALLLPGDVHARVLVFGLAHVALAGTLFWYVVTSARSRRSAASVDPRGGGKPRPADDGQGPARRETRPADAGVALRRRIASVGPPALGFLTGINLCPPFVVATVRAAELHSLPGSLAFFTVFFIGTSVWFLPFLATGAVRRMPEARVVARVAMAIVAAYYGYMGVVALGWRVLHG